MTLYPRIYKTICTNQVLIFRKNRIEVACDNTTARSTKIRRREGELARPERRIDWQRVQVHIYKPNPEFPSRADILARRIKHHVAAQCVSCEAARQRDSPDGTEQDPSCSYPASGHERDADKLLSPKCSTIHVACVPLLLDPRFFQQRRKRFAAYFLQENHIGVPHRFNRLQECADARFRERSRCVCVPAYKPE